MKLKYLLMFVAVAILLSACSNNEDKKVATVNDAVITQGQLDDALMKQYGAEVLESLMTNEIIKQEAKAKKIEVSEKDLDSEYQVYADYYGGEEALLESMAVYNMTKEDILNDIKTYLLTVQLLQQEIALNDDEIKAYYEENKTSYTTEEGEQLPFEDVKEDVEQTLLEERIDAEYDNWLNKKFEEYDVQTYLNK